MERYLSIGLLRLCPDCGSRICEERGYAPTCRECREHPIRVAIRDTLRVDEEYEVRFFEPMKPLNERDLQRRKRK